MIENSLTSLIPIIRGHIKDQAQKDGRISFEYLGDPRFTLPNSFVNASSIIVFVNNIQLTTSDWTFDSDTNQVTIDYADSDSELSNTDIILITYEYYKSFSDAELTQYVESSLSYFAQHRYKKIFELNEDEQIVCINDVDPTIPELYFITIIASILIDPQNIEIDTPEFKLTSNREDSDQEQIAKAFNKFQRFIGKVSFNKIEPDCDC